MQAKHPLLLLLALAACATTSTTDTAQAPAGDSDAHHHGKPGKHGKHGKHGKPRKRGHDGAPGGASGDGDRFAALDSNADGVLTPDEVAGTRLEARFGDVDTDGSGDVSEAEFQAGRATKRGRGRH